MKNNWSAFLEIILIIALIATVMAIIVPTVIKSYQDAKNKIDGIYNENMRVFCYCDNQLLYSGLVTEMPGLTEDYTLIDISVSIDTTYMYFEKK